MRTEVTFALLASLVAAPMARAEDDAEGCRDSPLVQRFPGAYIHHCEHKDFDEAAVAIASGEGEPKRQLLEGDVTRISYGNPESASTAEITRNYENALAKAGARTMYSGGNREQRYLTGRMQKGGSDVWLAFDISETWTELSVVRVKGIDQKVEVTAADLLERLGTAGRVAVYGVNFHSGKADLELDSEKVLGQVLQLLQDSRELRLKIEGHTDDVGKPSDNLELSKKRASAVKAWLTAKGVDSGRLATEGYGDTKPVAGNDTDAGKARNRRVELVKM